MRLGFESFVLESDRRELLREGKPVHLSPKAFQLLQMLLLSWPKALSKRSIRDELWPATFVSDASLTTLVNEVRSALDDDARKPRFLRTVPRYGYAFCASVSEQAEGSATSLASEVCFRLIWGDREIALHEGENLLGRTQDAVAWIQSPAASRRHARIVIAGSLTTLEDLGSKNGTFLQGRRIAGPTPIRDCDEIRVGSELLTFRVLQPTISTLSDDGR
jgi:DNA-binding winged helix-turn-helix (wHTH) protein